MRFASSLSRQLLPCSHDLQAPFASAAAHRSGPSVESIAKNSTTQARYALFQKPDGRNWPAGCFLFSKASSNTPLAPPLARFHPQFRSRGSNKIIVSYLRATPHHDQSLHQAARTAASNWFFFFFVVVVAVSMLSTVFLFSAARALLSAIQSTTSSQKRSSCNATDRKNRKQSYRGGEARERVSIFRVASSRKLERSKTTEMGRGFFSLCRFGRRPLSLRRFRFSLSKFFNRESLHWKRPRST